MGDVALVMSQLFAQRSRMQLCAIQESSVLLRGNWLKTDALS